MNKYLISTVLLAVSVNSVASDWEGVSFGSGVVASIDNESIRFKGNTAKIWVKWEYDEPQEVKYSYPKKTYVTSKNLELYKCDDRTSATIQVIAYSDIEASDVADTFQIEEAKARFSEIAPDTMGETILQWVCKKKPKQKK